MSDFFRAAALLGASRPSFGLGLDISREEQEEFRLEQERRRGIEKRDRRREVALGRGSTVGGTIGGLLGSLLGPIGTAAGAGIGSFIGQRIATGTDLISGGKIARTISPGAMKEVKRISPGRYFVGRGREREEEFDFGEPERNRLLQEQILTTSLIDAITGYRAAKFGPGILDQILGRGGGEVIRGIDPGFDV